MRKPTSPVGKYLLYAVGEILLVMVGILLALQVNNWNEANKRSKLEIQYLKRIKADLIADTLYFTQRLVESQNVIENHTDFIQRMYDKQDTKEEYKNLLSLLLFNSEHLTFQNSTYQELLSTGNINILSNQVMKDLIVSLYKKYEETSVHVKEINEFSIQQYSEIVQKSLKYRNLPFNPWPNESMFDKSEWEYINIPFSDDFKKLESTVAYYMIKHKIFLMYFSDLLQRDKEIVQLIEYELSTHGD
jgi:hypothetical protein